MDNYNGHGGSFLLDDKTGDVTLIERTDAIIQQSESTPAAAGKRSKDNLKNKEADNGTTNT